MQSLILDYIFLFNWHYCIEIGFHSDIEEGFFVFFLSTKPTYIDHDWFIKAKKGVKHPRGWILMQGTVHNSGTRALTSFDPKVCLSNFYLLNILTLNLETHFRHSGVRTLPMGPLPMTLWGICSQVCVVLGWDLSLNLVLRAQVWSRIKGKGRVKKKKKRNTNV